MSDACEIYSIQGGGKCYTPCEKCNRSGRHHNTAQPTSKRQVSTKFHQRRRQSTHLDWLMAKAPWLMAAFRTLAEANPSSAAAR
jgi:hypothetical protein